MGMQDLEIFTVHLDEGINKVIPLDMAIRQNVKPGMALHFAFTQARAHAAVFEVIRQYAGTQPNFTLIGAGMLEYAIAMVGTGLVKKMIGGFFGDTFPSPAPNPIFQKAYSEGTVEFECWTNLTICLGLMAGGLNIDYIPTNSLAGSSLAVENENSFKTVKNPFGKGSSTLVRSLKPDLTIVHGLAADRSGNTIVSPPYGEALWGALASKNGVVVTVEQIVSTETIQKYSNYVKVPGHIVRSVSVVPYGAHPQGVANHGLRDFEAYAEDYEFREVFRKACRDSNDFKHWIEEWVLQTNHQQYLKKLGVNRLAMLRGKAEPSYWREQLRELVDQNQPVNFNGTEAMISSTANLITQLIQKDGFSTVLAGIGASHLAAWTARYLSGKSTFELMTETGFYGYLPRPGDSYIFNYSNIYTNKMQSDFIQILGGMLRSEKDFCLGVLSTAEIDQFGNINSTKKPKDNTFLVGGGGSNDVASTAREIVALSKHSPNRLVPNVQFVTCPGQKVQYLVTDRVVMQKNTEGELVLQACLADTTGNNLDEKIKEAKSRCGWDLKVASDVKIMLPPTSEQLALIRMFDPHRYYLD